LTTVQLTLTLIADLFDFQSKDQMAMFQSSLFAKEHCSEL
jgi:hypothetical protein